jgi:hypothetical protein
VSLIARMETAKRKLLPFRELNPDFSIKKTNELSAFLMEKNKREVTQLQA